MPDTLVGATIKVDDFPPAVGVTESTANNNITSTAYITGSPTVAVTFTAPTSGAVLLTVGVGGRDNNAGSASRVHLAPQVRETNSSGALVLSADVTTRGVGTAGESLDFAYRSRTTLLSGLTPGKVYYAQALHKVSGGTTADINVRDLIVTPTPLGGNFAGLPIRAADFPPPVWAQDTTAINNPAITSYIAGTPQVSVTFTAPPSGRILLIVGGGLGNSAASDRIALSPEVRLTNSSGQIVLSPSVTSRGFTPDNCSSGFVYGSRESVLEGLTPGQVYFARVMYAVFDDGRTVTADISCREIVAVPLP
ncbi:hypothetical protein AB0C10_36495 [Microbispora amethystogenes]|uniref:hypothetical protein n=1 Tax=Microbispora amethystogenes TaxID=1427754 RepID=UPI0033E3EF9C